MTTDPSVIRSLAVSAEDLLAALEANARDGPQTVLRATPPYSGRMRARLHVVHDETDEGETLHLSPTAFLDDAAPPYPTPDETADELRDRADETYSVDRHHDYHQQQVEQWRESLLDNVAQTVSLPNRDHDVSVSLLGP
jgi:hypothetical protein